MSAEPRITPPTLRVMRSDDVQQVADIETSTYEFPWTIGIFRDCLRVGYCCVVLEDDESLLGYAVMSVSAGEAHLLNLCIRPDRQRCGLGRDMLDFMLKRARESEAERIFLEVRESNLAALALYNASGFKAIGLRRNYYRAQEGREDAIVLSLSLKQP